MKSEYYVDLSKSDLRLSGPGTVQTFRNVREFEEGIKLAPMNALTNRGGLRIVIKDFSEEP